MVDRLITSTSPNASSPSGGDEWDDLPGRRRGPCRGRPDAIVVKGAGDKAFISGADIAEFDVQRHDAASNKPFTDAVTAATACSRTRRSR